MFKTSKIAAPVALLAACSLTLAATFAAPQEGTDMAMPPMPKPTAEHAEIQKLVGTWEGTLTMFYPGMPETPMPAKETVTAINPFWVGTQFDCEMMPGMLYEGRGTFGFDAQSGKYKGTWIHNTDSFMSVMEGEKNEAGNLIQTWEAPDMMGKMTPHRSEQVMNGDDHYVMTFYNSDVKIMVIEMKRTSKKAVEAGSPK